jgi:hypothetical protein
MRCPYCRRATPGDTHNYEVTVQRLGSVKRFPMCWDCAMAVLSVLDGTRVRPFAPEVARGATSGYKSIAQALAEVAS